MPQRHGHQRQHRSPPIIRRPRVPGGQRLVRAHGWLTTDHPQAHWYRITQHSRDWSQVRVQVTSQIEDEPTEFEVVVQPNGFVVMQVPAEQLGAEAIRIIATAIRAGQRRAG